MKRAVITGRHLYGYGGGADATLAFARALKELGYETTVHATAPVAGQNLAALGTYGVGVANYYKGCSFRADLLLNIDHFMYERPLAKLNAFHLFHSHEHNLPPEGYQLGSANSQYTAYWAKKEWDLDVLPIYVPIRPGFYTGRKVGLILHVSRFAPPTELADKGHAQLIQAFKYMVDAGLKGWQFVLAGSVEDVQYFNALKGSCGGYPIAFAPNPPQEELEGLYAQAAFYWHATGAGLPEVHGAQEHLGLTTIEAMASGAVPIVLASGGQPEIVSSGVNGYLCHDVFSIQQMTLNLIGNQREWARLHEAALRSSKPWQDLNAFVGRVDGWLSGNRVPLLPPLERPPATPKPADVCAVVPCYNGSDFTGHLLARLYKVEPELGQVVVVNNGSSDDTSDVVSRVMYEAGRAEQDTLIECDRNTGFAHAMNAALEFTDKPYLLSLNNDTLPVGKEGELGFVYAMCEAMEPHVGVVGAKLIYPDGRLQHAGGALNFGRPDIGYHRWYGGQDGPWASTKEQVDFVTGACLLARRDLWRWPEWEGIGYEDADLCLEARRQGYQVVYQPAAVMMHYESMTRQQVPGSEPSGAMTRTNRGAFVEKWYGWLLENMPWWLKGGTEEQ